MKFMNINIKTISPIYTFLISFFIGLIVQNWIIPPKKKKIYIYPTPENIDKLMFKDDTNTCYQFQKMPIPNDYIQTNEE